MEHLLDCFGRVVRLTDERLAHIFERAEMHSMEAEISVVLDCPEFVRRSRSDSSIELFYAYRRQTMVGSKWLCVVVKYLNGDAFVVTAYLTDAVKTGEDLWPKK